MTGKALTDAQCRVLLMLDLCPGWQTLETIERSKMLKIDDIVVVPSLVEANFLEHREISRTVALTSEGREFAQQLREAKKQP